MNLKKVCLIAAVIGLAIIVSGCTGGQDVTPVFKALPEVQQFMKEHPNAKITVTYWSKEEVAQSSQEISQQCDKPITPTAMYKAIISEGDLKIVSWINAENQIVICSVTEGQKTTTTVTTTPITTITPTPIVTPVITTPTPGVTLGITPGITVGVTPGVTPGITPGVTAGITPIIWITPGVTPGITPGITAGVTPIVRPTETYLGNKTLLGGGDTWDMGYGYVLKAVSIYTQAEPKQAEIELSRNGILLYRWSLKEGDLVDNLYVHFRVYSIFSGTSNNAVKLTDVALKQTT